MDSGVVRTTEYHAAGKNDGEGEFLLMDKGVHKFCWVNSAGSEASVVLDPIRAKSYPQGHT